ncbi:MAG: YbaB/EbfC family nucleoid-associated protein [Alphaproteobacteria bacterium]|nr:YbaB/EbfC family nucleoid-associated protein [Alphaproteobacteria bacterium]
MDFDDLMAQAQALQDKVSKAQEELSKTRVRGISANGGCIMDMSGKYDLLGVKINEDILSCGADTVAEIFMDAYKDAKTKADALIDRVMGNATNDMKISE